MSGKNDCLTVSEECPVQATIYGYYPSLGANYFFAILFGIAFVVQFVQGIKWKTWTFMIALTLGCIAECIGYAGRIMLHHNPWDGNGFDIQICCLIIAPAFIAAGIYLNLKHIVLEVGPSFSHLRPKFYTWIFILCDLFSLVLQGTGGGIAATANDGSSFQKTGNDLMMAGIVWQVITLLLFGILVADYGFRTFKNRANLAPSAVALMATLRWKLLIASLTLAFVTVFTRCVFRIGEMAKGWANPIMRDETDFIVLDGVMITISVLCLTIFHPGYTFPEMQMHGKTSPVGEFSSAEKSMVHDEESTPASLDRSSPVKQEPKAASLDEEGRRKQQGYFGAAQ